MSEKKCTRCSEIKSLDLYIRKSAAPDGRMSECKSCNSQRTKDRRAKHPEKFKAWMKDWRANNKAHINEYDRINRASATSRLAKYRAKKLQATVVFGDDEINNFVTQEFYDLAKLRTDSTNILWHVDHIVPLQSEDVCGLHYYTNLRVITAKENQMKSNKYWEDSWQ